MPRSTREWAQRECDAAVNNIEWADKHLLKVIEVYLEDHPEIAAPLNDAVEATDLIIKLIQDVRGNI